MNGRVIFGLSAAFLCVLLVLVIFRRDSVRDDGAERVAGGRMASGGVTQGVSAVPGVQSGMGLDSGLGTSRDSKWDLIRRTTQYGMLPSALALQFTGRDEAELLAIYRSTEKFTDRRNLIWVLANVGGDETARAFIFTLTSEFRGRKLIADEGGSTGSEESVMRVIASCMGLLANRSEHAWDFLQRGVDPKAWKDWITWSSTTGSESYALLASSAIQGVGMTDRPAARQIINSWKESPPVDTVAPRVKRRVFDGDIVQAAFYADLREEKGNEQFYRWLVDAPNDQFDADGAYRRWSGTKGVEWLKWYKARLAVEE